MTSHLHKISVVIVLSSSSQFRKAMALGGLFPCDTGKEIGTVTIDKCSLHSVS